MSKHNSLHSLQEVKAFYCVSRYCRLLTVIRLTNNTGILPALLSSVPEEDTNGEDFIVVHTLTVSCLSVLDDRPDSVITERPVFLCR